MEIRTTADRPSYQWVLLTLIIGYLIWIGYQLSTGDGKPDSLTAAIGIFYVIFFFSRKPKATHIVWDEKSISWKLSDMDAERKLFWKEVDRIGIEPGKVRFILRSKNEVEISTRGFSKADAKTFTSAMVALMDEE